ncbi:retrovirus-related pol polyprotein from transposon TNT 1-94 [Tanacetum coccineum]
MVRDCQHGNYICWGEIVEEGKCFIMGLFEVCRVMKVRAPGEEDDEKVKDETCLVAHASSEVCSESSYFSDENSSIDDIALDNEYDNLEIKDKLSTLEKNKGVDLDCAKCHVLQIDNEKLKDESTRLKIFEKSTHCLNEMLSNQKPSGDKLGLGFNSFEASSSGTKEIKFVKSQKKAYSDGGQICDNKCRVTFSEHDSEITKDGKVIGRGIRKKGLYVMKLGNKPNDQICLTTIDENSTLWHRRLGHTNMCLIQSLAFKELVRNLPKLKFDQHFCDACKIGKQAHASHKAKNVVSTTRCLELLHMDLFGPSVVRSYGGNRYTLVIVDDYSSYTWTRFLKDKTEAFNQFEIFSRKIQNQLGCSIVSNRTDHGREFDNEVQFGEFCNANGYSQNGKAYIILNKHTRKVEELLNVTFDEIPPPSKTSPLVDDDLDEEKAIKVTEKKNLENDIVDETLEVDEIINIKESRNHPLENIIRNLNQRTLKSQAQNQSNLFCFISTIEPKNVNEALGDESWIVAMQEELNQFITNEVWELVPQPRNMTIIGTKWVFRNKLDENGIVSRNKARYIKEMLKKFGLEDSKPMKTPMSFDTKLTKDEECTTHLGLWYPKGTDIETVVYADSDHAGDYVDRKSTSGICTFVGCCLTSWFSKKQTALAISTTEAEYVSAGKACQQALWMKQALIDYDIRLDDVPIMCDNKGAIDLSKNPVQHSRTKHIEIRHHFLRDNVQKGHISIEKVPSVDNIADILTKPLKREF